MLKLLLVVWVLWLFKFDWLKVINVVLVFNDSIKNVKLVKNFI